MERHIWYRQRPFRLVACVGAVAIALALLFRFGPLSRPGQSSLLTSSTLTKVIDIADLSTSEFRYRGIADVYADEQRVRLRCRVCYSAIVKAGIDMKAVTFEVDDAHRRIVAALPEIDIKANIVNEQSMSVIPAGTKISIGEMLLYCKADAQDEATASGELIASARENLKATIEGLLFPILSPQGYTLEWQ